MNHSVFGYPGNKASLADWIIQHLPDHRVYVEVFGGAAGVLANKPPSHNEVYNDIDENLVQFFDVLRDRPEELVEWLQRVPYSREKYEEWVKPWYSEDWRPDDPVKRAGVFFYHRCVAFGGTYQYDPGFATSTTRNQARTFAGQVDRLEEFADRFREVTIENLDWRDCLEKYDDPDGLFYLDPPYYEARCRYRHGRGFGHDELADALLDVDANWIVSYDALPPGIQDQAEAVVDRTVKYQMAAGYNGEPDDSTETLAMSYRPDQFDEPDGPEPFVDAQSQLDVFVAAGDGGNQRYVQPEGDHPDWLERPADEIVADRHTVKRTLEEILVEVERAETVIDVRQRCGCTFTDAKNLLWELGLRHENTDSALIDEPELSERIAELREVYVDGGDEQ